MSYFEILLAIVVVVAVIASQLRGEALTGRRLMVLPVVLVVIGLGMLRDEHPNSTDVACLVIGGLVAAGIGAAQGAMTRLERRTGVLWARVPASGLWLWALLVVSRLGMTVVAHTLDAKVAASSATIFLTLGVNRLGQAAVLIPRVMSSGMEFAPEADGRTFPEQMAQRFTPPPLGDQPPGQAYAPGQPGPGQPSPYGANQPAPYGPTPDQPAQYAPYQQGDPLNAVRARRQQRRARRYNDWR